MKNKSYVLPEHTQDEFPCVEVRLDGSTVDLAGKDGTKYILGELVPYIEALLIERSKAGLRRGVFHVGLALLEAEKEVKIESI